MSIHVERLVRIVLVLAPVSLLTGCQGAGSSYPLFSIPGVTRVTPPGSWQHNGDATYYPDLTPATSGPVDSRQSEGLKAGTASLNWVPNGGQRTSSSAVVPAAFEKPVESEPVGSGVRGNSRPLRLLQPPTGQSAGDTADEWTSRHDPH